MMAACYHPDGFDDHNEFRGGPREFAAWVCEVLPHFQATHHFVADPYIRLDGDVAQVDTYCEAHHVGADSDMVMGLRYVDRFERRDGRVAHRHAGVRVRLGLHRPVRPRGKLSRSTPTSPWATATAPTSPTPAWTTPSPS